MIATTGTSPGIARRTVLKAAAVGAIGVSAAACARDSANTLTIAVLGNRTGADAMRSRLEPPVKAIDPSITLRVNAIDGTDWNDFFTKLLTQIAAGRSPDIVLVATEGLQLFAARRLAIPLDDFVKRDAEELGPYFADTHPSLIETTMYEGHVFALPIAFNAADMYYSTRLFESAGVELPAADWTIDDFHRIAVGLGRYGAQVNASAFSYAMRLWGSWTSFMYANGGNLLEEGKFGGGRWLWDGFYPDDLAAEGRDGGWRWGAPTANSPAVVEALDYMVQLRAESLAPPPIVGLSTLQGLFSSNRIGMAIAGGYWAGGLSNAKMPRGSFDVQFFPSGKVRRHMLATTAFGILNPSPRKELAWEVVKRLMVEPGSFDLLYPGNTSTPVRRSLVTAERYATTGPPNWHVFYDSLTTSETTAAPAPPYYNALATALNQRTTQAISSGDAKTALDAMQRDLENIVAAAR